MAHNAAPIQKLRGSEWRNVGTLLPYVLEYKWRVLLALVCLISAKLANVGVPLIMKQVVDRLEGASAIGNGGRDLRREPPGSGRGQQQHGERCPIIVGTWKSFHEHTSQTCRHLHYLL